MNPPFSNGILLDAIECHASADLVRVVVAAMEGRPLADTDEMIERLAAARAKRASPMSNEDDLPPRHSLGLDSEEIFRLLIGTCSKESERAVAALAYHFATWAEEVGGCPEEAKAERLNALLTIHDKAITGISVALKAAANMKPRWVRIIVSVTATASGHCLLLSGQ